MESSPNEHLGRATESSPLLGVRQHRISCSSEILGEVHGHAGQQLDHTNSPLYPHALIFIFVLSFIADLSGSLVDTPEVRLLELAICRDYYLDHDPSVIGPPPRSYVDEKLCKIEEIQIDLAYLRAFRSLLMTLPGLLLTVPYSRLADRVGRKPVAFLGMLGQIMSYVWVISVCYFHQVFPSRLVLLSPIFLAIGGGSQVLSAVMAAVIADSTPENMRTTVFYLIGAGQLLTDIVAAPVGSWLLSKDLWHPFKFSAPIICLSLPLILAMPETLGSCKDARIANSQPPNDTWMDDSNKGCKFVPLFRRWSGDLKQALRSLDPRIIPKRMTACLCILFVCTISRMSGILFVQYTSKLLDWSISTAGYLLGVKAFVTLCTLVILAGVSQILGRTAGKRPLQLDVWVVRLSLAVLTMGTFAVAASHGPVLLVIGSLFTSAGDSITPTLQGLLAEYADASSRGQLFGCAALLQLLAQFAGSLAFPKIFAIGMGTESNWGIGLPFYVSSILFLFATFLSYLIPA